MLKKIKEHFGFIKQEETSIKYPSEFNYADNLDLKTEYLKELDKQEDTRRATIDSKISQLIGQTGIIFSILSLFISNYISEFNRSSIILQLVLIILFIIALFFYLYTIIIASNYLNVSKYKYGQRDVATVRKKFNSEDDFKIEEIKDLIYSIERNTMVTNQKCNKLIYAYRSFRIATITVGILSISLITAGYFMPKPESARIKLENPVIIKDLDSLIHKPTSHH